jgi:four helix bundle protein
MAKLTRHTDLDVYRKAFTTAMQIFELTKTFPKEETYSLTDQVRRSSCSVNANLAEAWRKRRYEAHFISKLSDSETEAGETQSWLEFCVACKYLDKKQASSLYKNYDDIIRMLVSMIRNPKPWLLEKQ